MEICKNNVDIFICAHKPFDCSITNKQYKIICGPNDDVVSSNLGVIKIAPEISNVGFSEWQKFYYVWKHMGLKDYVGLMHYRRILTFGDDINYLPDFDELFEKYGMLIGDVVRVSSVWQNYKNCHNIKDLQDTKEIINQYFPEYNDAFNTVMNRNVMFICNNCVMKKDDFLEFCDFLFGVLFKFCERNGIDPASDQSFYDYIDKDIQNYSKRHKPEDSTFREQARIGGFLSERLFNVWAAKKELRIKSFKIRDCK